MPATESSPFISPSLPNAVTTDVNVESSLTRDPSGRASEREAWQRIIDDQLIEWGWNSCQLEDEGVAPPTRDTIQRAIRLAEALQSLGLPPPDSVVPDPDGAIVFERRQEDVSETFHVWENGTVEYCSFRGTRLFERRML